MLTIFTSATASFTRHNIKTIFAVSCLLFYSLRLCFDSKSRRSEAVKSLHRSLRSYLHNAAKLRNSEEGSPTNARSAVYVEGFESRYPATLLWEIHIEVLRLCCLGFNDGVVVISKHGLLQPSLSTALGVLYSLASLLDLPRLCLHRHLGFGARVWPLFVFRQQNCLWLHWACVTFCAACAVSLMANKSRKTSSKYKWYGPWRSFCSQYKRRVY